MRFHDSNLRQNEFVLWFRMRYATDCATAVGVKTVFKKYSYRIDRIAKVIQI